MDEIPGRILNDLIARLDGPLHFRFFVQPAIATILAVKDGLNDERHRDPAYFVSLFTEPQLRRNLIRDGWRRIARVFFLAVMLDAIYQVIALRWFYPFETLIVAIVLALLPYAVLRGVVNRVWRAFEKPRVTVQSSTILGRDSRGDGDSVSR